METPPSSPLDLSSQAARQQWMSVLATAPLADLELAVDACQPLPSYVFLRPPEIGLAMVRGRAGGDGSPFNLGEITLTRCVVQLKDEQPKDQQPKDEQPVGLGNSDAENGGSKNRVSSTGFGYVAGRSLRQAELAAVCDALLQTPAWQSRIYEQVVVPLAAAAQQQREQQARQTDATQVNFFTMLRGEVS